VTDAFFFAVVADRGVENGLALLASHHAAGRKRSPVPDGINFKVNRSGGISGTEEVGMEAMGAEFRPHCVVSGHQTLGDDLSPKDPLLRHQTVTDKGESFGLTWCDVLKHFGKTGHRNPYYVVLGRESPEKKTAK
jgi:hypothetical protein